MAEQGSSLADAFGEQKAEELADGRELPRARGRRQPFAREPGEKGAEMIGRGVCRVLALGRKKGQELGQVARIGLDGVGRGAALGAQHVEKRAPAPMSPCRAIFASPRLKPFRATANARRAPRSRDAAPRHRARPASAHASASPSAMRWAPLAPFGPSTAAAISTVRPTSPASAACFRPVSAPVGGQIAVSRAAASCLPRPTAESAPRSRGRRAR